MFRVGIKHHAVAGAQNQRVVKLRQQRQFAGNDIQEFFAAVFAPAAAFLEISGGDGDASVQVPLVLKVIFQNFKFHAIDRMTNAGTWALGSAMRVVLFAISMLVLYLVWESVGDLKRSGITIKGGAE